MTRTSLIPALGASLALMAAPALAGGVSQPNNSGSAPSASAAAVTIVTIVTGGDTGGGSVGGGAVNGLPDLGASVIALYGG
ncbi:hypothetical protein [Pseudooceanicola aestuarii]|uniref:hypothetical protein n=1 Tax=Pseudooceanicola aestuarii TaxID=2697319 RepID=UPI0013D7F643|nr:hypothetical protein [Pseudooceanicola aestuarii]